MSQETFYDIGPGVAFDHPIALPTSLPTDAPHVALCVNHDWVPIVAGCLKVLLDPATFDASDADFQTARRDIWNLLQNWQDGCMSDERFQQIDGCLLQRSVDGGVTWVTIYDGQTCIAKNLENGTIAGGSVTPQESGTPNVCVDYHPAIDARGAWQLPNNVNAGDTLEVTVEVNPQVWTDDIFLETLYCIDGTFWDPITGCGAGDPAHSGDPDISANHMELLLAVNGVFYRIMAGKVTIPAGVVNAPAYFLPNDVLPADNLGQITVKVEHCAVGWSHIFDFTVSDQGWVGRPGDSTYAAGVGWEDVSGALYVQAPARVSTFTLIGMAAEFTVVTPDAQTGGVAVQVFDTSWISTTVIERCDSLFETGGTCQGFGVFPVDASHAPTFAWTKNGPTTAQVRLTRVTLYGSGTDPY